MTANHNDTFNWEAYWRGEIDGGPMDANASGDKVEFLERFFDAVGTPASFTSIGCGEALGAAALARSYPEMEVRGYDVSPTIIERNCEEYADRSNLSFAVTDLPNPRINREFELVYCYATLQYVRETERALTDLYALVAPGGHLVVHYPNEEMGQTYREGIDEGTPMRQRFRLVCDEENLISRERIATLLDAAVYDFWDRVDAPDDVHGDLSWNPCVYVPKPVT